MSRDAAAKEKKPTLARKRAAVSRAGSTRRKAPTGLSGKVAGAPLTKQYVLAVLVAVITISASVGIGISDAGAIDVTAVIEERNTTVATGGTPRGEEDTTSRVSVPVQNTNNTLPNGGLRGAGDPPPPPSPPTPQPETGSSTATSSDVAATSTEATATSSDAAAPEAGADEATEETDTPPDGS